MALAGSLALQSCTTVRIIRHRDPAADRPQTIFAQRPVHRADAPAPLAVATPQRADLDTVTVRDVDQVMRPLAEYLKRRHVRAFLVMRNDTVLYERYAEGYGPATTSSSFSMAKSVLSALLGRALASGAIRSLDDSVVTYLPELRRNPAYAGVTLRHLLGMASGIAYSRTNGHAWHDLWSGDARFYYSSNFEHSLGNQKRENPPGLRWEYKDSDAILLGWVLARATGQSIAAQLEQGIWRPIGAEHDASWDLDHSDGHENAASGLNATARDFARLGRLYLEHGVAHGSPIVPQDWVEASTTLDRSRTEPEVPIWWQMQHQHYWWIPMQNWDAERDFFADGSRGQRIYVHPRGRIVIVQLANESAQEFPFRKLVHYLLGEPFRYPVGIAGRLAGAARSGAGPGLDSRALSDARHARGTGSGELRQQRGGADRRRPPAARQARHLRGGARRARAGGGANARLVSGARRARGRLSQGRLARPRDRRVSRGHAPRPAARHRDDAAGGTGLSALAPNAGRAPRVRGSKGFGSCGPRRACPEPSHPGRRAGRTTMIRPTAPSPR
jgi:CubicO group peptidase (beta-lactamase class C family)